LIPHAAHSRFDSCWSESERAGSSERFVARFESASISGIPPVFCGAGSFISVFCDMAQKVNNKEHMQVNAIFIAFRF